MADINSIIKFLDEYLAKTKQERINAVDANKILNKAGLLSDSKNRPGKPLRDLLRTGSLPHAYQVKGRFWFIPHSGNKINQGKNFEKIVNRINSLAIQNNHPISNLMILRRDLGKITRIQGTDIFGFNPKRGSYTFHKGGNKELQFNFGEDNNFKSDGSKVFRYGIAFSIERGPHFYNPEEIFKPKVNSFNNFLSGNISYFKNYLMYINRISKKEIKEPGAVKEIVESDTFSNTFIFIGNYIDKPLNKITDSDIELVLKSFDYLLEVYKYIESDKVVENKIARLCWNTNEWIKPSGIDGKTISKSHEREHGYGHEEWLFDFDKVIDGYHYGFIEPINKFVKKYVGNKFNLLLYSINSSDRNKYWIGQLNNVEVIDTQTSLKIIDIYRTNGWINEMKNQLEKLKLNSGSLDKWIKDGKLFNIRFKPNDLEKYFASPRLVDSLDSRITSTRYNLLDVEQFNISEEESSEEFDINTGNDGDKPYNRKITKRVFHREIELVQKHNEMSYTFLKFLKQQYPNEIVKRECKAYESKRIDIVRETNQGNIFYEIKTYNDPVTSIRNALGQIFEYAFYPNKRKAIKLIIVSHRPASITLKKYIQHLNEIIDTPLSYIHFDPDKKLIVSEL